MKTMFILMSCCQCGRTANSANWQPVVNAIPCICWGIIGLIALFLVLKSLIIPAMTQCHEKKMKQVVFNHEIDLITKKEILDGKSSEQNARLDRSIREFESIELNKIILSKINSGDDIDKIRKEFDEMKKDFDGLRNKICNNTFTLNIKQKK